MERWSIAAAAAAAVSAAAEAVLEAAAEAEVSVTRFGQTLPVGKSEGDGPDEERDGEWWFGGGDGRVG
jgi:hypothetical protein